MQKFRDIVNEYTPMLYWHIRRIVVSHEDAEDILQDTFVKAYRRLWTLRNPDALKPWLYRIATNEANNFLSRSKKTEELPQALENALASSPYVDLSCEAEIRLQKAVLALTPAQRTVFNLRYYDEMSYEQIAQICKSTPGSVKVLYHNAKEKVTKSLEL